jgi:mRNA interferase MazF
MCEFPLCFEPPEMVKERPVIVISPRIKGRETMAALIPLSTTAPDEALAFHCKIPARYLPAPLQSKVEFCWAKCDMLYTLSFSRLHLVRGKRDPRTKQRTYHTGGLDLAHIQLVRRCMSAALGITADILIEKSQEIRDLEPRIAPEAK